MGCFSSVFKYVQDRSAQCGNRWFRFFVSRLDRKNGLSRESQLVILSTLSNQKPIPSAKNFLPLADKGNTDKSLKKANHSKEWDAKPPAYVPCTRDKVAGFPGERSADYCASLTPRRMEVL
jgi:hypothetical protein